MSLKVALYVSEIDIKGGTHKQVLRLAQYLKNRGHVVQVHTLTYVSEKTFPEFSGIDIVAMYRRPARSRFDHLLRRLWQIWLAFKMKPVDVINIHDNGGLLFFFAAWVLRRASNYVWQINDLHWSFRIGNSSGVNQKWHYFIARILNRLMAKHVDCITVNVSKNVDRVQRYLNKTARLFYCGVDLPAVTMPKNREISTSSPFHVLSIGGFFRFRNYERIIEAAFIASNKINKSIIVTIVGDTRFAPDYVDEVKKLAADRGIALIIKSNLDNEELDAEIARCNIFCFVNVDQSWGLAVFEAAARSKAVVLSNSVGASELLRGHNGFYMVDPLSEKEISQAFVFFISNPIICLEFGEAAARRVKEMTWDIMYSSKVEELFNEFN